MKHTKGPWKISFNGDKSIKLDNWKPLDVHSNDEHYEQVNTYDKALIEAAPEMLEALLLVRKELTLAVSYGLKDEHVTFVLKEIEQALNKARGGE